MFHALELGTLKWNKKVVWAFKIYLFISSLLSVICNFYVMIEYTIKINGGIININFIIQTTMQFFVTCRCEQNMTGDEISCHLNGGNFERLRERKVAFMWIIFSCIAFFSGTSIAYLLLNGPNEIFMMTFGFEGEGIRNTWMENPLLIVAIMSLSNMVISMVVFAVLYSTFVYSLLLLARQNLALVDSLIIKCELINLERSIFLKLEELYLTYKELVEKLNSVYGRVPFWFLMLVYANITAVGTFMVISNAGTSTPIIIGRNTSFLAAVTIVVMMLINMSGKSYESMNKFRQKGLQLVNSHIKGSKIRDVTSECLANTLRGVELTKMKAGQMYDMEPSIVISLIASAIPMTVMVVSLLKELRGPTKPS